MIMGHAVSSFVDSVSSLVRMNQSQGLVLPRHAQVKAGSIPQMSITGIARWYARVCVVWHCLKELNDSYTVGLLSD